ncbi:hypothetical protein EV401DRAFT_2034622 [Pisolithus croceorrhizus]|nr:hypothetical protein EV401DRAFT_2034622 [Pisolithus croceorrhizus]
MAAIPGIGAPLAAAIDGLVVVVQVIDRQIQNREALDSLTRRLYTLCCHIANAPAAQTPFEDAIRRALIKVLEDTTQELWKMRRRIPGSTRLTQDIAGCFSKINDALVEFTVMLRLRGAIAELGMRHLPAVVSAGCVVVVDATGEEHNMLLEHCCSFEQLRGFLPGILSKCRPDKAHIQQWYIDREQYDFAIDNGTNITQLTREGDIWSTIQPGTKIVVRVIITELSMGFSTGCRCQCGKWNEVNVDQATAVDALKNGFTITCYYCERRFQVTRTKRKEELRKQGEELPPNDGPEVEEKSLIRNFWKKQVVPNALVQCGGCGEGKKHKFFLRHFREVHLKLYRHERNAA